MESKISEIAQNTAHISKAINTIQAYSYQYNLKIVGVPQAEINEKETDTVECNLLLPATFGLNPEEELKISIFSHLTPRLQELFYLAKAVKEQDNYK